MSDGDLRRELVATFGSLFEDRGFQETYYMYDAKAFGNEILDMARTDGTRLHVVRDRSQVFVDLGASNRPYLLIDDLFEVLGLPQTRYDDANGMPAHGMPEQLVLQIKQSLDDAIALLSRPDTYERVRAIGQKRFNQLFSDRSDAKS